MVDRRESGFTIIEVLMFLGISGLLLIGAIASFNGTINTTRFNDAVNSTTSYIQKEYAEVVNGQNVRSAALGCSSSIVSTDAPEAPGMSNCVVLGRLLQLGTNGSHGNAISSKYIVGQYNPAATGTDSSVLATYSNPRAVDQDGLNDSFSAPWSTDFETVKRGVTSVNYIAIIRSPISGRVLFYSFPAPANQAQLSPFMTDGNLNQSIAICMSDDDRTGYVRIGAGQGQDVVKTDLSNTSGSCS